MKTPKIVTILFFVVGLITATQAQTLDRVSLSSGGISSDTLNATLGEIFVFSVGANGISLDAGSQSDDSNTGGIPSSITVTKSASPEVLVYPNPVADYLSMQINGLTSNDVSFQVFDINGKLVMQHNSKAVGDKHQLQVKQLANGQYFIQGYSSNGENIGKIKFIKL